MSDLEQHEVIQLSPSDPHSFHNYNHFGALCSTPNAAVSSEALGVENTDIIPLSNDDESDGEKVDILRLIEKYEKFHATSDGRSSSHSNSDRPSVITQSSDTLYNPRRESRKLHQQKQTRPSDHTADFSKIQTQIEDFIRSNDDALQMRPMPPDVRRNVIRLAEHYRLSHRTQGKKVRRSQGCLLLRKTSETTIPQSSSAVDRLVSASNNHDSSSPSIEGSIGDYAKPKEINFRQLHRDIKTFLRSSSDSLAFDPMPAVARKFLHELAQCYQLATKSRGSDPSGTRHVSMYKTEGTMMTGDLRRVDRLLEQAQLAMRWAKNAPHRRDWKPFGKRPSKESPRHGDTAKSPEGTTKPPNLKPKPGTVVGKEAAPLGDDNKGMQLLRKLGWSPGTTLGQAGGITEPVEAVVRLKRKGL